MKEINERIKHLRRLAGLNQTDMGDILGIKTNTFSQKERTGNYTGDDLAKLAEYFKVDAEYLLFGEVREFLTKPQPPLRPTPEPEPKPKPKTNPEIYPPVSPKELDFIKMFRLLTKKQRVYIFEYVYKIIRKEIKLDI